MPMLDSELCALIDREARNSIGVDDEFALDRRRAMEFYMGEAKGELSSPSIAGRSKVVSKDLMDTVEWAMPALMRMFASQDDIVRFEPEGPEDDKACEDATNYIGYLLYRKNPGFITLHDAIKSALIARMGVTKTYCDKSWEEREERYEGLSQPEVDALQSDPDIEVVEVTPGNPVPPAGQPEGLPPELAQTFSLVAKRREQVEKFICIGVPPEEMRISKDCREIENPRFIAHEVERTRSDLISEGWDKKIVEQLPSSSIADSDAERQERHAYDQSNETNEGSGDESQQLVRVTEAYMRVDFNGDGIAEYRKIVKSGTHIQENEVVDDHPFSLFTPILMPYKVVGLSFYDLVEDLMRVKTVLTRQTLDNVYQSNNQMFSVAEGQVNLDDLLNPRPGGLVRRKNGAPADAIVPLAVPFVAGTSLELIQFVDQTRNTRTGVTEMNSALNAESLAKGSVGSEGVQAMMQAGAQRIELIARVLAETGIKRQHLLMLKLVTQYQNRVQQMKLNGHWLKVDPREWKNRYDMTISVGIGNASRQQQVANLTLIGQAQQQAMQIGLASPQNIYHTLTRLAEAMGYKDSDQFFTPPPEQPPPQQPPMELQLEQMKQQGQQQLAQVKGQTDIQVAQMQQEFQAQQAQQETELEAQRNQIQMQNEMAIEQYKVDKQMELESFKAQLAHQTAIETAQISAQAQVMRDANRPEAPRGSA